MIGNVWEWCEDKFDKNQYKYQAGEKISYTPSIHAMDHVLRGGSFVNDSWYARCTCRDYNGAYVYHYNIGFRVCIPNKSKKQSVAIKRR
jgi:formylglycine-generating enzyme required for sulfatase activity